MATNIEAYKNRFERVYMGTDKPAENFTVMNRYIRKVRNSGLKPDSIALTYQALQIFSKWLTKPLDDLTEDDILDFTDYLAEYEFTRGGKTKKLSPVSIKTYRTQLKKFFTAMGKPELAVILNVKSRKLEPKDRKDLLTKSEIERLIHASIHPRDKAIVAALYESGARKGELLACRIWDVTFDEYGALLTFPRGKTGKRTVRLVYAAAFLRNWLECHPCRQHNGEPDPEASLFVGLQSKQTEYGLTYETLLDSGLNLQLRKIARRAGITKRVNPHSFRHARATDLAEHLTEQQLKKYLGWTQSSTMAAVYVHDPDTDNAILKMNGIKIDESQETDCLKVNRCPRCRESSTLTKLFIVESVGYHSQHSQPSRYQSRAQPSQRKSLRLCSQTSMSGQCLNQS